MLDYFRKASQHLTVKVLLALLVCSFAFFGVTDFVKSTYSSSVATIGNRAISIYDLNKATQVYLNQSPQLQAEQIKPVILQEMVNRQLLLAEADSLGLDISPEALVTQVKAIPAFLDEKGQFSTERYKQMLQQNGVSESQLLSEIRDDAVVNMVVDAFRDTSSALEPEVDRLYRFRNEQRVADILVVPMDYVKSVKDPTDAELQGYYDANKQKFSTTETRTVDMAIVECKKLPPVVPTDAEVEKEYEKRATEGEYWRPERRTVQQITVDSREKADEAYTKLGQGEAFDAVAKSYDTSGSMNMGEVTQEGLLPELQQPIFSLSKDSYSKVVESPLGFHIFRVTEILPSSTLAYVDVKDALKKQIAELGPCKKLEQNFAVLEDEFAGGLSLAEAAKTNPLLKVTTIENVTAEGKAKGKPIAALESFKDEEQDAIVAQLFSSSSAGDAVVNVPHEGVFLLYQVTNVQPARIQSLDEVRGTAIAEWKKFKQQEESLKKADEVVRSVKDGKSIVSVAQDFSLPLLTETIKRGKGDVAQPISEDVSMSPMQIHELFKRKQGEVTDAYRTMEDSFMIAVVKEIIPVEKTKEFKTAEVAKDSIRDEMKQAWFNDMMTLYMAELRKRHKVSINESLLKPTVGEEG